MVYKSTRFMLSLKKKFLIRFVPTMHCFVYVLLHEKMATDRWYELDHFKQLFELLFGAEIKSNLTQLYRKTRVNGKSVFYLDLEAGIVISGSKTQRL